ncbi:MAG: PEP-CTERM sorting domain-containing protein [Gemmatimonadaceae bacterium]|nr:PEP-CTERM sorting domain-containing protein [Gemmatimonadaceae bacterium]
MTQWIQAEDFSLSQATTITGIRFWAFQLAPQAYAGSIVWRIYDNAGTTPGANVLFSGVFNGGFTNEGPGACCGADQLRFDIGTNFNLNAGSYWLGLHNGPLTTTTREEFYWQTRANNATLRGREDATPFDAGGWFDNGNEHAFQLLGRPTTVIPEPSTYALLATGFVALAVTARRRRRV